MIKRHGFTLIELLIVVAIIGILAAIAIPNFLEAQTRAKVAQVKGDMRTLGTALEEYRIDQPEYPMSVGTCVYGYLRRLQVLTTPISYVSSIPEDPFALVNEMWEGYRYPCIYSADKPHPWTYDYSPLGYWRRKGYSWEIMFSSTDFNWLTVEWGMLSMGPDAQWHPWNPSTPMLQYDASNGTISDGDIYLIGPGHGFVDR